MTVKLLAALRMAMVVIVVISVSIRAFTVPRSMNYQGRVTDAGGSPLSGLHSMTFSIYDDSIAAAPSNLKWQETHPNVTVSNGFFSVVLGGGNPAVPLTESVFGGEPRFLDIRIGNSPLSMHPRIRIGSFAYAFTAQNADTAELAKTAKSLVLPYADTVHSSSSSLFITNTGEGAAGFFKVDNPSGTTPALRVLTNGMREAVFGKTTGCYPAGQFQIDNASCNHAALVGFTNGGGSGVYGWTSGNGNAVEGKTTGGGAAGQFIVDNLSSAYPALNVFTNGTREAIFARTVGCNPAGNFQIDNPSCSHAALAGSTNGSGVGVLGTTSGSGSAVRGTTTGLGFAGEFVTHNPASNWVCLSAYTTGNGPGFVSRTVGSGAAGFFQIDNPSNSYSALSVSTNGTGAAALFDGGNVGVRVSNPTSTLDISGPMGFNQFRIRASYTPSSSLDPNGNVGDIAWDDNYLYVKTNVGWKRSTLVSW